MSFSSRLDRLRFYTARVTSGSRPCPGQSPLLSLKADLGSWSSEVGYGPILLQKSKVAAVQIFGENLKRKEVNDSHSLSRATEVAHEFGAGR